MPKCSVIGCGTNMLRKPPDISLHRLPTVEARRNAWLEIIGTENIDMSRKHVFICSFHFEDSCFNRTMNIIKLRDGALPSKNLLPPTRPKASGILTERDQNEVSVFRGPVHRNKFEKNPLEHSIPEQSYSTCSSQDFLPLAGPSVSSKVTGREQNPVTGTNVTPMHIDQTINMPLEHNVHHALPVSSTQDSLIKTVCLSMQEKEDDEIQKHIISAFVSKSALHLPAHENKPGTSAGAIPEHGVADIPDHALQIINKLKAKCQKQAKQIKRLNEKVRRQGKKIAHFATVIKDLKQRNLLSSETAGLIEDCAGPQDFLKRQIAKSKGFPLERQYSEEISLHFYSPKAYDFVRRTYNTCLPHRRTLCNWYRHVNAEPGFCTEAFQTLKANVQQSDYPVICALTFDEMAIRKSLCWDAQNKTYCGRVNFGATIDSDAVDVASQCLVFLINCINGRWKLPVGYFLITSMTGEQKAALLEMCVEMCTEVGVKIVSVTCDGPAANFTMFSLLGCDVLRNQNVTTFNCSSQLIHIFIDPCHAIKLIRNTFGELKVFYDIHGRKIDFAYLERLQDLQEIEGLHMATKLTKAHIMFAKQKMKVRLATQLLSNSVADAINCCENKLKLVAFQGAEGTINFIKILNDVFDVLNSQSVRPPGWKKALCPENVGLVEALFDGAISYINNLKLPTGQLLVNSKRKTGFVGLIVCMKSAIALYKHLVEDTQVLKYVPLYKVSQDHLELFFSAVRARGGFNNNPNAVQFKAAFKRLLIRAEIRDGGVGNCIPLEQVNVLTCSSKIDPITALNDLTTKREFVEVDTDDGNLYDEFIGCLIGGQSRYTEYVVTYIAGFVARKLAKTIKCEVCVSLLYGASDEYSSLINLKTRGGLIYPSKHLEEILTKTEKILKNVFKCQQPENYYLHILKFFIEYSSKSDYLLNSGDLEHDIMHKYLLMKSIIKTYMNIRFKYFGKKTTETISFRNHFNKLILFRNE